MLSAFILHRIWLISCTYKWALACFVLAGCCYFSFRFIFILCVALFFLLFSHLFLNIVCEHKFNGNLSGGNSIDLTHALSRTTIYLQTNNSKKSFIYTPRAKCSIFVLHIFRYGRVYSIVSDFTQTHVREALAVHCESKCMVKDTLWGKIEHARTNKRMRAHTLGMIHS